MNIRRAAFLAAVSVASCLAAEPSITLTGVMTAGGKTRFALTDTAKKTTTWVEAGDVFNGYTVTRYDPKDDVVFVRKNGQETRLSLVSGKSADTARPATPVDAAAAANTAAAIRANLRLLANAAHQYQLEHGVASVSYADLVGPGKPIREIRSVAGENYSTLSFGTNVTGVNVTTTDGTTVALDLGAPSPSATPTPGVPAVPAAGAPTGAPASVAITATAAPALEPTGRQPASPSYNVQGGDTWEKISESTGVPVPQLKQLNPAILEGSQPPAGQTIRIH